MTKRRKWWLGVGVVLVVSAIFTSYAAPDSDLDGIVSLFAFFWIVASFFILARFLWRWATYRVGVRLFISYLLLGVLPFVFCGAFAAVGLYILMGQYTSVRFGSELRRVRWELVSECKTVLHRAEIQGAESAFALLEELAVIHPEPLSQVFWQARIDGHEMQISDEETLPEIGWFEGDRRDLMVRHAGKVFGLVGATSPNGNSVVAAIPLDRSTAETFSNEQWFDVAFLHVRDGELEDSEDETEGRNVTVNAGTDKAINFTIDEQGFAGDELWQTWSSEAEGFLARPLVVWFRVSMDMVDLESGEPVEGLNLLALLRTSPANVWNDFTLSRYKLGSEIWGGLVGLGLFFVVLYSFAFAVAGTIIYSITRSLRKLSLGARQVESGDLEHRISEKRRDQLGDLGRSFNHMTGSIQSMLADVAEKEHLARELELAREIQESLLPALHLELGLLTIHATFQPAAEVGGDYFDVFPLAGNRLVLAIGDVAGHGLSTGLLMASLKSTVAALVFEGYTGSDLINKVNHLLMEHGQKRTMVTLAILEIDTAVGRLKLANAGHPPGFILGPDGQLDELEANSVPLGSSLCVPAYLEHPFVAGGRLLLYSDGLVEAVSEDGEPFGYERFERLLQKGAGLAGPALTSLILETVAEFTGGAALTDDLTLLIIERKDLRAEGERSVEGTGEELPAYQTDAGS